jgi:small subunit ribosomal protein S8
MAANDTIADMLTRIRNANMARHQVTHVPATKVTRNIAKVLQSEGIN